MEVFVPKYETFSDMMTYQKSGSIEPKREGVSNNTILYMQAPCPPKSWEKREREREQQPIWEKF